MNSSIDALLYENYKLKSRLHMYEQYQVLLRIQKNLAISLGKTTTLTEALDMILETVTQTEGVIGAGVLFYQPSGKYILCAHTGISDEMLPYLATVDPEDNRQKILLKKGHYLCDDCELFTGINRRFRSETGIGVYPVMRNSQIHAVLLVCYHNSFKRLEIGLDLLDAITNQIEGVIERVEHEDELRQSLKEKEILLKEVHHRVKNNLAMINSFISLQEDSVEDENALNILYGLQQKIESIVSVYALLYKSGNLRSIQFDTYCIQLIENMISSLADNPDSITFEYECDQFELSIDQSITIGLILSELTTNSLKYAFPDSIGKIILHANVDDKTASIVYQDSGNKFPDDFDLKSSIGLGERIVMGLTDQLKATLEFSASESKFRFVFPVS